MIHSSTLARATAAPVQPLHWIVSRPALLNAPVFGLAAVATVLDLIAIASLLSPTTAAQSDARRAMEIGGGNGAAHPTSGDIYTLNHTADGRSFTPTVTF